MLDGYSIGGDSDSNVGTSLDQIASGFLTNIANAAAGALQGRVEGALNNAPRSSNTAPAPDVAAAAARPAVSTFVSSSAFGVSLPILLIGGAALVYLVARK